VTSLLRRSLQGLSHQPTVGILGLAYKAHTDCVTHAAAIALIRGLPAWRLQVYDPVVPIEVVRDRAVAGVGSAIDAARGADAVAVMTPWPEFTTLSCVEIARVMRGRLVLDPYRVLDRRAAQSADLDYYGLG